MVFLEFPRRPWSAPAQVIAQGVVSQKFSRGLLTKGDYFLTRHVGRETNTKKELIGRGHYLGKVQYTICIFAEGL